MYHMPLRNVYLVRKFVFTYYFTSKFAEKNSLVYRLVHALKGFQLGIVLEQYQYQYQIKNIQICA